MQPSQCICPVLHVILHAAGFVSKALLAAALTPGSCPLGRGQLSDLVFLLQSHDTKTKKTAIQDNSALALSSTGIPFHIWMPVKPDCSPCE